MIGRFLLACILAVSVNGCTGGGAGDIAPETVVSKEGLAIHPKHFEISLGGFTGPSYRVELQDDGSLLYLHHPESFTSAPGTKKRRIKVTDAQWRQFRGALEEVDVWNWDENYTDPRILDGTQWLLRIVYDDASVYSHGSNSFPPGGGFKRLRSAVVELIGGREFK